MKTKKELTQAILDAKSKTAIKPRKRKGKTVYKIVPYTWRDVAAEMYPDEDPNCTGVLLNKIVNHPKYKPGYAVCLRLGLIYSVPVQICKIHGVTHCYDCQSQKVVAKHTNGNHRKRTPPVRIGEATSEEMKLINFLSPKERKKILVDAASDRRQFTVSSSVAELLWMLEHREAV
jgi:hypothetical protein